MLLSLSKKILSLSNLSLSENENICSRKIISERKNKLLLWIYARQLSGHLWFNGRLKSPVASLNWNPWQLLLAPYIPECLTIHHSFEEKTIFKLRKGAKRSHYNSNFINKIEGRSNTAFSNLDLWSWTVEPNLKSLS